MTFPTYPCRPRRWTCPGLSSVPLLALLCLLPAAAARGAGGADPRDTRVQPQADGSQVIELDFAAPLLVEREVNGRLYTELQLPGATTLGRPGAPALPVVTRLLRVPDRGELRLDVLAEESEPLHGLLPWPEQDRLHQPEELPLPWLEDEEIYGADADYPGRTAQLDRPARLRDLRVVKACFHPVQVNPLTGEGRVLRRLRVRVSVTDGEGENPVAAPRADPTPVLERLAEPQLLDLRGAAADSPLAAWFEPGRLPGHYLVFAPSAALGVSALQDYLAWKRRRGHTVTVVSSADMTFTTTNIRNRIIQEYQGVDPVDFVLLVGDVNGTYAVPTHGSQYDHYYATIAGNDILGDVAVGRLSCNNATQLSAVCNKIRAYESQPYLAEDAWLTHSHLQVGNACMLSMKILERGIAAELVQRRGYDDIDTNFCVGSGSVLQWFNDGMSIYVYRGYIGMDGLDMDAVRNLAQGPRTPVASIFTCGTGDFDSECYSEAFLKAGTPTTPGGAVAAMGFATSSTHTRYNNVVVGGYFAGLLEHDVPEVGACLLQGKYELYRTLPPSESGQVANFSYWGNLMGDPGTCQWAGVPEPMQAAGLPAALAPGDDHLALTVSSGGQPVAGAAVCAYQDQGGGAFLRALALSDADGQVLLPLAGLQAGTLRVTATEHRHVPLLADLPVAAAAADPALADPVLPGGALAPGAGLQEIALTLVNGGSAALSGLSLAFSLDPAFGDLVAPIQSLPDLAPGAQAALAPLALGPAATLAEGDRIPLAVQVSSDQGGFARTAWLPVAAPHPSPTGTSTPQGPLTPGETGILRVHLANQGSRPAAGLMVSLASLDPSHAQVTGPPVAVGDLAPGGTAGADFAVLVGSFTLVGHPLPLRLDWSTAGGAAGTTELLATVGTPSLDDPTGPDGYGYWAFEDDDAGYDLAPVYDWIPVAPAEGGAGTELPLADNGNEQDDGRWLDLPFPFTYYGVSYTELMVCSNGFVSFAENGFGEFDFRNHWLPGGMGPDAMIAPMWDDHLTTGTAGVWTWHDEDGHRFVIEWRGLPAYASGGPNTFQLVLYDPLYHPTMTGDGPFLFQYQDFNDTQEEWTDFPFCTVGIKDESGTRGMTLRNFGVNAPTLHGIADGTAIFFTTSAASSLDPPALVVEPSALLVELTPPAAAADSLLLRNTGQLPLIWNVALLDGGLAAGPAGGGERDSGGPDAFGYVWEDSREEGGPVFAWQEPEGRQALSFVHHDSLSAPLELGYTQFLYGAAFARVRVSPNGYLVFGPAAGGPQNLALPDAGAPSYMVAPWWEDLKPDPNQPGQVWYWSNGADSLVVAWDMVPHLNPFLHGGPVQAQAILRANGEITLQVGYLGGDFHPVNHGGTCGVQGAAGVQGFTFAHNEDVSAWLPWAIRLTPPAWVSLSGPAAGMVPGGDSTWVRLDFTSVPGFPLPDGLYASTLRLQSNDLDHMVLDLPVQLAVSGSGTGGAGGRPARTELGAAAPNPFNPAPTLSFDLAATGPVRLAVYDLLGRECLRLVDGTLPAGTHRVRLDGGGLASGLYLARLEAAGGAWSRKLVLIK